MQKQNLRQAHQELVRRSPDERFDSLDALRQHCRRQREQSRDHWQLPRDVAPNAAEGSLKLDIGSDGAFLMNDWSFSQLCSLAKIHKETANRLSAETAALVFRETMPARDKPLQVLTSTETIRSIHGASYTRLWNAELLDVVEEFATDFQPPQTAVGGGTGLYAGEQDMFAFLIDPAGWTEINGEAFAPGFFVWNSEVGKRSLGIQTFWYQRVCQNHIVWDATEVTQFSRKHTVGVREGLEEIRRMIELLVACRDSRRDGFVGVMKAAMQQRLGHLPEEVAKVLTSHKIPQSLIKDALELARQSGGFTIFSVVDALTQLTQKVTYAGDRTDLDAKIGKLMALAL